MDLYHLAIEKSVPFFCLVQLTEITASFSERGQKVFSKRYFEIVLPVFEVPFWEPDAESKRIQ